MVLCTRDIISDVIRCTLRVSHVVHNIVNLEIRKFDYRLEQIYFGCYSNIICYNTAAFPGERFVNKRLL